MRSTITFMILRRCGSKIHQASFPRKYVYCAGFVMAACLVVLSLILFDYYQIRQTLSGNASLTKQITDQQAEIEKQRKQIRLFANELNSLTAKLNTLNEFQQSIRTMADIHPSDNNSSLSGIGGSMPEDLNPVVPLEKDQDSLMRAMHAQVAGLHQASDRQTKEFQTIIKYFEDKQNLLVATPSIQPAQGRFTSGFGYRISPFTGLPEMHKGLDMAALRGEPILAAADGIVSFVGIERYFGKTIVIDHGHGVSTRYAHCDAIEKKHGEAVKRGDVIAQVGNTGRSTGPHLHYEVRLNGVQVNPKRYITEMFADKDTEIKAPLM